MFTRVSLPLFQQNLMLYLFHKKGIFGNNTQLKWGVLLCWQVVYGFTRTG